MVILTTQVVPGQSRGFSDITRLPQARCRSFGVARALNKMTKEGMPESVRIA